MLVLENFLGFKIFLKKEAKKIDIYAHKKKKMKLKKHSLRDSIF